jgi:hypothetical protein
MAAFVSITVAAPAIAVRHGTHYLRTATNRRGGGSMVRSTGHD